jgi:hypothetical protein
VRRLIAVAVVLGCACGGSSAPSGPRMPEALPPISVEWQVEQGEGNTVNVTLVVAGRPHAIGALDAATEYEAGTPSTCALRAASTRRTEIVCGDHNAFAAELVEAELVISRIAEQRSEVKRIPVSGDALAVKMLVLPGSKL